MAGPVFRMRFDGLDKFIKKLEARPDKVARAVMGALYQEGEELMAEAKQLTPVDTGTLRSSGHVRLPVATDTGAVVELGFGGPAGAGGNRDDVGYAVYVHEDLTAHHPVGQAKFLEAPLNARKAGFPDRFTRRVRAALDVI